MGKRAKPTTSKLRLRVLPEPIPIPSKQTAATVKFAWHSHPQRGTYASF
jgi:hypothetical protein